MSSTNLGSFRSSGSYTSSAASRKSSINTRSSSVANATVDDGDTVFGEESLDSISPLKSQQSISMRLFKIRQEEKEVHRKRLLDIANTVRNTQKFMKSVKDQVDEQKTAQGSSGISQIGAPAQRVSAPAALAPIMRKIKQERKSELLRGRSTSGRAANEKYMNSLFLQNMDAEEYAAVVESNQGIESNDTFDVSSDIRYDEARHGYVVRTSIVIKERYAPAAALQKHGIASNHSSSSSNGHSQSGGKGGSSSGAGQHYISEQEIDPLLLQQQLLSGGGAQKFHSSIANVAKSLLSNPLLQQATIDAQKKQEATNGSDAKNNFKKMLRLQKHKKPEKETAVAATDADLLAAIGSRAKQRALAPFIAAGIRIEGEKSDNAELRNLNHEMLHVPHVQLLDGTLQALTVEEADKYFGRKARDSFFAQYVAMRKAAMRVAACWNHTAVATAVATADDNDDSSSIGEDNAVVRRQRVASPFSTARSSGDADTVSTMGSESLTLGRKSTAATPAARGSNSSSQSLWQQQSVIGGGSSAGSVFNASQLFSDASLRSFQPTVAQPRVWQPLLAAAGQRSVAANSNNNNSNGNNNSSINNNDDDMQTQVTSIMSRLGNKYFDELESMVSKEAVQRAIDKEILSHNSFQLYQSRPYVNSGVTRRQSELSASAPGALSARSQLSAQRKQQRKITAAAITAGRRLEPLAHSSSAQLQQQHLNSARNSERHLKLDPLTSTATAATTTAAAALSVSVGKGFSESLRDERMKMGKKFEELSQQLQDPIVASPRTKYLSGCIRDGLQPMPNLVIRKLHCSTLNLAHYGMGDRMGCVLADCIKDLPVLERISLADNNLTDDSLKFLVNAITQIPTLQDLDLSRNKIDGECSDALAEYVSLPDCPLVKLTLMSADVDDGECDRFVQCLTSNKRLIELDLSSNLLGSAEIAASGDSSIKTGGESLAQFITSDCCRLQVLKLAWNSIRLRSAVNFCNALALNATLQYLDLSNNGMGFHAGEALGDAIMENRTLKTLLVANNNFTSSAFFCMCVGVVENLAMEHVNMNENPIGDKGARMVMQISVALGSRVTLTAANCNTVTTDERCWYDPALPCGDYTLRLDRPFDRAVAFHLLFTVANHSTFVFQHATYEPTAAAVSNSSSSSGSSSGKSSSSSSEPRRLKLQQTVAKDKENFFNDEQREVVKGLRLLQEAAANSHLGTTLFYEADADNSGRLDKEELQDVLHRIGFRIDSDRLVDIMAVFDVDGAGTIDLNEFLCLLRSQHREAALRIKEMTEYPIMVLASEPAKKYVPPRSGILRCKVVDGFVRKRDYHTLTSLDQKYAYEMAKGLGDVLMMSEAVRNTKLRINEAYGMYRTMFKETGDKVQVLVKVLPQMMHPHEARQLVAKATLDDRVELARIKMAFGVAVRPIFGSFNGFYCLDLSKEIHRLCLVRLMEQSQTFNATRAAQSIIRPGRVGDTSQHGNWTSFRNAYLDGDAVIITPAKFTPLPQSGRLEFDFSGGGRPSGGELRMNDRRVCKVLNNLCLLRTENMSEALNLLAKWAGKAKLKSRDGKLFMPMYEFPVSKALEVGLYADDFYENLQRRQQLEKKGAHKEEIKVHYMGAPGENKKFAKIVDEIKKKGQLQKKNSELQDGDESDSNDSEEGDDAESSSSDSDNSSNSSNSSDDSDSSNGNETAASYCRTVDGSVTSIPIAAERGLTQDGDDSLSIGSNQVDVHLQIRQQRIREIKDRLQKLLNSRRGVSVHAKAARFVEVIEESFQQLWILTRHLVLIIKLFQDQFGNPGRTKYFGSYAVDLVVMLFPRVVDIHNIELLFSQLDARDSACVLCRIGYLNIFNPMKPEVTWELSLDRREERQVAKLIVYLSVVEPGLNLTYKRFQWKRDIDPIPGWDVTEGWMTEEGIATHGKFAFTYYSGEGKNRSGCYPDVTLRKSLCHFVLLDENEVLGEEELLPEELQCTAETHYKQNREVWEQYLLTGHCSAGKHRGAEENKNVVH